MQGFKILTALCVLVSLVAAKGGKVTVPKHQTKNVCYDKKDGDFLPVSGSCTKYIICYNGSPVEKDCGKFQFSAKYLVCDHPDRVGCVSPQPLPHQTTSKPVAEKDIVVPKPTLPPCYAVANGISLPVPGSQRQYYYCMNNKAFLKDCGNMYFVAKYSACSVKPENSDSSIIVPAPEFPSSQDDAESSVCFGKPNGASIAVAENPRHYHYCMNNKAFLKDCGSKMIFAAKYSACTIESDESTNYPVEELQQTDTFKELASKICRNKNFGARLSLPGYCSLYVICTVNTGFVKTCGWREFNSETASCDLPENVRCQAYNQKPTEKLPEIQSTPKPSINTLDNHICLNQNDGAFLSAPGSCSEFFFCLKKIGYRKTCGNKRHFNPKSMICVDSKYSKCVDTSFKKSERAIIPRDDSNTSCIDKENGILLSSSTSCGKFRICDNGIAKEMDCPAGLYFNTQLDICDWPTNVQCDL